MVNVFLLVIFNYNCFQGLPESSQNDLKTKSVISVAFIKSRLEVHFKSRRYMIFDISQPQTKSSDTVKSFLSLFGGNRVGSILAALGKCHE